MKCPVCRHGETHPGTTTVTLERGATRFCPNMEEHCHYYCDACGEVFDVALTADSPLLPQPKGFKISRYDIAVHGVCADCARKRK